MKKTFFVLTAVSISTQLLAQPKDTVATALDEVIITANKYPNKTSLTGKVVTIITREQLERSGGKDLSQVLNEQTGLYIGGANSNAGKDKSLYLRGARVDHTLITIDGVPVYDPSGIGGNFDIRNLAVQNIERIEILKGSQSTLYGSDAIAGVINIITRKNTGKTITGNAGLSYGSNETFRSNAGINGRRGNLDYNAAFSYQHSGGINEAVSNTNTTVTDKDGFTQRSVQLGFGFRPVKQLHIQPFFRYGHINGDIDQGAFTDELDYTYRQKSWQAGVRNELELGTSKLTVLYNYNAVDRSYTDDSVKSRNGFDTWSQGMYKGHEHFADAYLHMPLSATVKLTAGLDFRASQSDQQYGSVGFFGPYATNYAADSLHQNQLGIYAAMNWNSKAGFNLEMGSRLNIHSEYGSNLVFNINPSYLVHKTVKLYANISSAYRTPSLYQLFSEYGNKDLSPEAAITGEAGVQYIARDNKATARITGFVRNVKEVIFFYSDPVTFRSQYINQDKQKDHGVELEAAYTFQPGITLKTFYTYVTGEITTRKSGKDTTYFNLLRRPKSSGGLNLSWKVNKKLLVSSNLQWFGKREDAYFDNNTFSTVNVTLKSYALWDLYAEYGFGNAKWKVFADLRNVADAKYTEISGFQTMGFNGYGGVRLSF
ncbi:MAG: TonB-dependent receptor [Bacteroidetes bacterium]|nr:TonB-dependent receptor [Bacteroidota bacterium]